MRGAVDAGVRYESRFADVIFAAAARYDLSTEGAVLPYATLNFDYDTRSGVPGIDEVYNDNAVVPALGLRAPLGEEQYAYLYARAGYSFGLRGQTSFPDTRWGFDYSRDYGESFLSAYPHAQLNANISAYSRYAGNVIGSIDAFSDARLTSYLRTMAGAVVAFDDHRDYGNNYVEAYAGLMIPFSPELDLRLAGVEGTYLSRGVDVPKPASYSSIRVALIHSGSPP